MPGTVRVRRDAPAADRSEDRPAGHPLGRAPQAVLYSRVRRASPFPRAGLAQLVEQLFRKQQVVGSSPTVGSTPSGGPWAASRRPKWRNRQTRYVQGVVGVTPWEFKSPLRHPR